MGGMHGFGPVPIEKDEPVFHEEWEGRLYGLRRAVKVPLFRNTDESRYTLENLPPAQYLGSSYYERWLATAEIMAVRKGLVSEEDLEDRRALLTDQPDTP